MNRSDRTWLRRLRAAQPPRDLGPARARQRLRFEAGRYRMLIASGMAPGPEAAAAGEAALATLAAIPDTPELQQSDRELLDAHSNLPPGEGERIRQLLLAKLAQAAAGLERERQSPAGSAETGCAGAGEEI